MSSILGRGGDTRLGGRGGTAESFYESLDGGAGGKLGRVQQTAVEGVAEDPDPVVRTGDGRPAGFPVRRGPHEVADGDAAADAIAEDGLHDQLTRSSRLELLVDAHFGRV